MKQKLFDKFAELFGNSDGAHFYFSPGRVNLNIQTTMADMYFPAHLQWVHMAQQENVTTACYIFIP